MLNKNNYIHEVGGFLYSNCIKNSITINYKKDFRVEHLACRGCHYCRHAHEKWGEFLDDDDDAER